MTGPDAYAEAVQRLQRLFARAQATALREPAAATLATADAQGRPSVRTVLLKLVDQRGCVFYTNLQSRKSRELTANPRAALCCFWQPLYEQVTVEGAVEQVPASEADAYWARRDHASQIGAWASLQSQPLDHYQTLLARVAEYAMKFGVAPVPRPAHWSGFRLTPDRFEFWTGRPARLHERTAYVRAADGTWTTQGLYP